jgi:transposase
VDELVADDDVLRRVERLLAWGAVREFAASFYFDVGRPGVDLVVLVKVFLVAAIGGIGSMREMLRIAEVDLSIRRFLGYGLTEALPHHSTFSYAQCVRFANSSVFEQLFAQVLASCRDAGLLDRSRLIVDATHVEADAALKSLRASYRSATATAWATSRPSRPRWRFPRPGRAQHRSARRQTRPRFRGPIRRPSCATSRPPPASGVPRTGRDRPGGRG